MKKFFQRLQNAYEPLVVLLIVGVALLLIYALYWAMGGTPGKGFSIVATFDDVSGIKDRSKVLFKGMLVGSVTEMKYDRVADHILVRLEIVHGAEIPANIEPSLESSLFGEAHIMLKTIKEEPTNRLLAAVAGKNDRPITELYKVAGKQVSKAESLMPGSTELARITKEAMTELHNEMIAKVSRPVQDCVFELERILKGPQGQGDQTLATELTRAIADLKQHSASLDELFDGKADGSAKGLLEITNDAGGNWEDLVTELKDGKKQTLDKLDGVSKSLDAASRAVARSESEVKKLGNASDKLGVASQTVTDFVNVVKKKPNSMVWGWSRQQKEALSGQAPSSSSSRSSSPPTSGAGKR